MNDTTLVLTSISLETTTCEAFHFFMFFNHVNVKFFFYINSFLILEKVHNNKFLNTKKKNKGNLVYIFVVDDSLGLHIKR